MRRLWVLVFVLVACNGTAVSTTTEAATPTTTSVTAPTSTLPPVVECPGAGDFAEGGGIASVDGALSDSYTLSAIGWEVNDQCETLTFEFETSEGAPSTQLPSIRIDHLETFQVLRIRMDVEATVVTDQLVETDLVDRLFVVSALDGGFFVDIHLRGPVAARAAATDSPAALTVDLRPGLVPFEGVSSIGAGVVVVSPADGAEVDRENNLAGYFLAFDSDPLVTVEVEGEVVSSEAAVRAPAIGWAEFTHMLELDSGDVTVLVGDTLGAPDLVTINLTVR